MTIRSTSTAGRGYREAAVFYAVAMGLSITAALSASHVGEAVLVLTMATPMIAVACVIAVSKSPLDLRGLGLARTGWRLWPAAIALALLVVVPGYMTLAAIGGEVAWPTNPAAAAETAAKFLISIAIGTLLGAFWEEIGWRGFLLPRLMPLGFWPASLAAGFLQGLWHLPLIVLTPYYHDGGSLLLTIPVFLIVLTLAGPIFGHLRLAGASILPAAICHRTVNLAWDRLDAATAEPFEGAHRLFSGEAGFAPVVMLSLLCIALLVFRRETRDRREAGQVAA